MKNQKYGRCRYRSNGPTPYWPGVQGNARENYKKNRANLNSERERGGDGRYSCYDDDPACGCCYVVVSYSMVRYDEGPKDKEWMEEGDWEYIQKLYREGTLLEKEPIADMEIVKNHKYRDEITRTLRQAYVEFRGAFIIASRRAVEQFEQAVQKLTMPDRAKVEARGALKSALSLATIVRDEELFRCCRTVLEQLTERYPDDKRNANTKLLLSILKDLLDKHERREILLASERQALRDPSYARLIAACWKERSERPTIQQSAEILKPLEAEKEADPSLASGPVQLDNFASVAPR